VQCGLGFSSVVECAEFFFALMREGLVCLESVLLGMLDYAVVLFLFFVVKEANDGDVAGKLVRGKRSLIFSLRVCF